MASSTTPPIRCLIFFLAIGCLGLAAPVSVQAAEAEGWQPPRTGLGYDIDLDLPRSELPRPVRSAELRSRKPQPLFVRVMCSWSWIEQSAGLFRWEELDRMVEEHREAGFEVILTLRGGNPIYGRSSLPLPDDQEYLEAWKTFLGETARRFNGRVRYFQISDVPEREDMFPAGGGPREYAFLVKTGAVQIRAMAPEAQIVSGSIAISHLDYLEAALREGLEPYLDAVPIRGEVGVDPGPGLDRASELLLQYAPPASLWLVGQPLPDPPHPEAPGSEDAGAGGEYVEYFPIPGGFIGPPRPIPNDFVGPMPLPTPPLEPPGQKDLPERAGAMVRDYAAALANGARLVLFDLRTGPQGFPELSGIQILLRRLFLPTLGPASGGISGIRFLRGETGEALETEAWKFFDGSTFQVILVYAPENPQDSLPTANIVLDTADVTGAVVDDLVANSEGPVQELRPDPATDSTRVAVPYGPLPLLLRYQRFASPGFLKDLEELEVGGKRELRAEEIIARHQQFQADQDHRFRSLKAKAKLSYHYKVASSDLSVDVTTINNFFWDREVGAEWEQIEQYFNGVKWKHDQPLPIHLVQPEKVVVLPLDIHLNKDYTYHFLKTDVVDGRECYLLEFKPISDDKSLYQGKVWIDRTNYAKVKVSSVQTGLDPPIISNDERDTYAPAPGTESYPIWVLHRIEGQQIFTIGGTNLVLQREIEFSDFELNNPAFKEQRQAAYDSESIILRDTDRGFRYLEKGEDGTRLVREGITKSTTLAVGGIHYTKDLDYPIPLVGIDHFDFDFRGTGTQANLFFAGALLQASIQNPHLFGTRIDAGASLFGIAFSGKDQFFAGDEEIEEMEVRTRTQSLSLNVGYPLGNFLKIKGTGLFQYAQFGGSDKTGDAFVVPEDTTVATAEAEMEYNRRGYSVQARYAASRRDRWEPWGFNPGDQSGLPCDPLAPGGPAGTDFCDFDTNQKSYSQMRGRVSKLFVLPLFQKIAVSGEYLSGRDLDRFSKYQFSFFGTRVHGFSGSGVRFDRGGIGALTYSFNLGEVIRFEATLDHARVRDTEAHHLDSQLGNYQDFTGFGVAGSFLGPWETVIRFDYGVAVDSDIPGLSGDQEIQLLFLKLF